MNKVDGPAVSFKVMETLGALASRFEAALEPVGLSLAKLGVLSRLVAAGEPLPLSTLAERSACVRSNITQLIDRLEADKLVVRVDDPHDRRLVRAALTAEGRARYAAGARALVEIEKQLFPDDQRESLVRLLGVLQPKT
jgi:MarR family 2-MHQ and catechol resistance regulon transcriptional repressor